MNKKKSFLLYDDLYETLQYLNDEQLGKLTRMIFDYRINGVVCDVSDPLFFCFTPIRVQMERDDAKYKDEVEKRSIAGKASAEARANKRQHNSTHVKSVQHKEQVSTNPTDNVNDSESDSDSDNDILNIAKAIAVEGKKKPTKKERFEYKSKRFFKDDKANNLIIEFFDHLVEKKRSPTERSAKMIMNILREAENIEQIIYSIETAIAGQYFTVHLKPPRDSYPSNLSFEKNKNGAAASPNTFSRASNGLQIK
jgi:hypothetical protein